MYIYIYTHFAYVYRYDQICIYVYICDYVNYVYICIYVHMYICICIQIHHTSIIHIDKGYPFSHLTWNILRTTWPQTWTDVFETPTIGHVWSIF